LVDYPGGPISIVLAGNGSDPFAGIAFLPDRYGAYGPGAECQRAAPSRMTAFDPERTSKPAVSLRFG
jgi:hypothetical protein